MIKKSPLLCDSCLFGQEHGNCTTDGSLCSQWWDENQFSWASALAERHWWEERCWGDTRGRSQDCKRACQGTPWTVQWPIACSHHYSFRKGENGEKAWGWWTLPSASAGDQHEGEVGFHNGRWPGCLDYHCVILRGYFLEAAKHCGL